ncbi:ribosome small subunit-dependent GTPase A, partial [Paenibacillus dakarensis]|uniref:ribosome small subunit-dependent GTPase A n=1 Tax=Paenibacillus dakarensis TaxID=1527293 RepID=UPI0009EAB0A1
EAGNVPDEQVIAANTDTIFIVNALNQDFNVRKIERYLISVWESGAQPVVLLTKADLCVDPEKYAAMVMSSAPGVPVHAVSSLQDQGKETIAPYLVPGHTVAITGSSGAGKSTLLNWLSGQDVQRVQGVREEDARGRHTTTHRELFLLPEGAVMIDTPGMRELQLWDSADGWGETFFEIEELARQCRFQDCRHESETGCAVQQALLDGELDPGRFKNYKKTEKELAYLARKERTTARRQKEQSRFGSSKSRRDRSAREYSYSKDGYNYD